MSSKKSSEKRIAIFISFSGQGGVERMVCSLAGGMVAAGYAVDMILIKAQGEHVDAIPEDVRVIKLKARHTLTSLPELVRYLRRQRPDALLAAKHRAMKVAVMARWLAGSHTRLVGRLGTTVSAALDGQGWLRRALWYSSMRFYYRWVDQIIAVSEGVAADVRRITHLPTERVRVVRNPVITPRLQAQAAETVDYPWLQSGADIPVILGAGRFTRQKDFDTLIHAFARLRRERPCRLLILGEGKLRPALEALVSELGLQDDVALPGFATNPYAAMARAQLFVLSSRWEGSPNVLTEAMALGVPVASTDCPSGPKEILQDGRYGKLVAMGDVEGLAAAMAETLDHPLPAAQLQAAVSDYSVEASSRGYLDALGLGPA
jgi:glycosyltransferase involved in cell wall biosynthesis